MQLVTWASANDPVGRYPSYRLSLRAVGIYGRKGPLRFVGKARFDSGCNGLQFVVCMSERVYEGREKLKASHALI
jgi:hypothetical protein